MKKQIKLMIIFVCFYIFIIEIKFWNVNKRILAIQNLLFSNTL